jgi:hypothetical protein
MFSLTLGSRRWITVVFLLVLGPQLGAANEMPGADAKWRYYQSPNFELYSHNPERESRRLLRNLELVHAVFFETFGLVSVRPMPMTVFFFAKDRHFVRYVPEGSKDVPSLAAYYLGGADRGVLLMAPLPSFEDAQQLAFAGYTMHLLGETDNQVPLWYGWGLSAMYENLVVTEDAVELGRPDGQQLRRLMRENLIPVEVMLGADAKADAFAANQNNNLFRDESWALLHYLYFGKTNLPRERVLEFVGHVLRNSGKFDAAATQRAFEEKLGLTYEKMNAELYRYVRIGRNTSNTQARPRVAADKDFAVRDVPLDEITLRLSELSLRVKRSPVARLALLEAIDKSIDLVRLEETLGADASRNGDIEGAAAHWEKALAAGSTNVAVLQELCQFEGRQLFDQFDPYYQLPDMDAARLRERLGRLIAAAPRLASAHELLAWVEGTAGEVNMDNVSLVQANLARAKDRPRTLLALALVKLHQKDKPGACALLDEIEQSADASDWVRQAAKLARPLMTPPPGSGP